MRYQGPISTRTSPCSYLSRAAVWGNQVGHPSSSVSLACRPPPSSSLPFCHCLAQDVQSLTMSLGATSPSGHCLGHAGRPCLDFCFASIVVSVDLENVPVRCLSGLEHRGLSLASQAIANTEDRVSRTDVCIASCCLLGLNGDERPCWPVCTAAVHALGFHRHAFGLMLCLCAGRPHASYFLILVQAQADYS